MTKHDECIFPFLRTHTLKPENQETPIKYLRQWITPEDYFFQRNHFSYPPIRQNNYTLQIDGAVNHPCQISINDILKMTSKTLMIPLECAGNKRALFKPEVFGTQWEEGAVSQGCWTGVPLQFVLERAGLKSSAREVVCEGHDCGKRRDIPGIYSYARSLSLQTALHPDTLIATMLNGKPLPYKHGYPLRLIVPGWYGMSWVKWLNRISVIEQSFGGPFQTIDYNYYPDKNSDRGKHPVTLKNINSTILSPHHLSNIDEGIHQIEGVAWTGKGVVTEVEISTDNGSNWRHASLKRYPGESYAWVYWHYTWSPPKKGEYTILAKAKDSCGRIQPAEAYWNRKGYGYNAISRAKVKVE